MPRNMLNAEEARAFVGGPEGQRMLELVASTPPILNQPLTESELAEAKAALAEMESSKNARP